MANCLINNKQMDIPNCFYKVKTPAQLFRFKSELSSMPSKVVNQPESWPDQPEGSYVLHFGEDGVKILTLFGQIVAFEQIFEGISQTWRLRDKKWYSNIDWDTHYFSLDLESNGPGLDHPITAIGFYLGPQNPNSDKAKLIKKGRLCLKRLPGQVDYPETMEGFWANYPDILAQIEKEAQDPFKVMADFKQILISWVETIGLGKFILVADCPDFDIGRLQYLGHMTRTIPFGIRFMGHDQLGQMARHSSEDPSERVTQIGDKAYGDFLTWLHQNHPEVKHTHLPDDDAEQVYWEHIWCDQQRSK